MVRNYLVSALRILRKHKAYSALNIIGLSFALVPVLVSIVFIRYEFSYDRWTRNWDRIYRVVWDDSPILPNPLASALKMELPEVECAVRLLREPGTLAYKQNRFLEQGIVYADTDFFKLFTCDFIRGNQATAFSRKNAIVLSQTIARKYFGDSDPVGQVMRVRDFYDMIVTGVYRDLPPNSHFKADAVLPNSLLGASSIASTAGASPTSWGFGMFYTYIRLREHANPDDIPPRIPGIISRRSGRNDLYTDRHLSLQPLSEIHLLSHFKTELRENGSMSNIYVSAGLAATMLFIAVVNYVNMATARSTRRTKEIAMRKVFGAQKGQLMAQFLTETFILTLVAFIVSIVFVRVFLGTFDDFLERSISVSNMGDPGLVIGFLLLIVIVSLCGGAYPAFVLSSSRSVSLLSGGRGILFRGSGCRQLLVGLQFVLSIGVVFVTIIIGEQNNFIRNADLGFDRDNIVILTLYKSKTLSELAPFETELRNNPDIIAVSSSANLPNGTYFGSQLTWPGKPNDEPYIVDANYVDHDFIDLYGMKIVQGRNFSREHPVDESGSVIISEATTKLIGWNEPIGKTLKYRGIHGAQDLTVIGVVKDFHMFSLYKSIAPFCLLIDPVLERTYVAVKVRKNKSAEVLAYVRNKATVFQSGIQPECELFSDIINHDYQSEFKFQTMISTFSLLSVLIASLGLLGLVSFTTETRQKEIGIRKVLGASSLHIGNKLVQELLLLILVSGIVAVPISLDLSRMWLSHFAYRAGLPAAQMLLAALAICTVSIFVVFVQVYRAASKNPLETLKYE